MYEFPSPARHYPWVLIFAKSQTQREPGADVGEVGGVTERCVGDCGDGKRGEGEWCSVVFNFFNSD